MKVYFHLNIGGFSNCYIIANEVTNEAVIIDPGKITEGMTDIIETNMLKLSAVFITHNHGSHVHGLKVLQKIYSPLVYAVDYEVAGSNTHVLTGDGIVRAAGFQVHYLSVPGHTSDSMVYQIGRIVFTGDVISAGRIGSTISRYSTQILCENIERKILSLPGATVIMPGHGPPTCVATERLYNIEMQSERTMKIKGKENRDKDTTA